MVPGLISLVFICYLVLGANANVTLKVSNDISVKPTPDPLADVTDAVNVTLRCEGSRPDLNFYIPNTVSWTFISAPGKLLHLTEGFYATEDAKHLFTGTDKRFTLFYANTETGYAFDINITRVGRSDEGTYRCSLKKRTGDLIDSKDVKLTVVNRVQTVTVELYDVHGNLEAKSSSPLIQTTPPVNKTSGQYLVKCVASGSNPEPVMNFFLNELKQFVDIKISEDSSTNVRSYTGVFSRNLTISSKYSRQELVCEANIPGEFYASRKAGIVLMARSDKLTVRCENTTAALADRNFLIKCEVYLGGQFGALRCDGISWSFGTIERRIGYEQIWKDQINEYGDMESTCAETKDGLSVSLNIFTVTSKIFDGSLSLVYESGAQNFSHSVEVYETAAVHTTMRGTSVTNSVTYKAHVGAAAVVTPLSFSAYTVVVVITCFTV